MSEDLELYWWTLFRSFFLFHQYTALSSRIENSCQMYFGGSIVGETSLIDLEILPTPPQIFTVLKSAKFGIIFNITQLWFTHIWKCSKISELWNKRAKQQCLPYFLVKFGEVRSTHTWELSGKSVPPRKIARQKCAKSSLTQLRIVRFGTYFVQSLNFKHDTQSAVKVQGQEIKSQGHSMT